MVRRLVGTLVLVGEGRLSVEEFAAILAAREKALLGRGGSRRRGCV